ncbi:MAG: SAM-dependent methyltransferase, partial [Clostridiales bacterium]|nr:SAM-dependent methyltransferase [Clostridiales bacterium]
MKVDFAKARSLLRKFDFRTLWIEHLGWDHHTGQLQVPLDGTTYVFDAIAQKRGFQVFVCPAIPDRPTRLKLDRQVTKSAREHLIVYADPARKEQLWEWVRREQGKPVASRDFRFRCNGTGQGLLERLEALAISLAEEEQLTLPDLTGRVKAALDVDKITKRFYERFKAEHTTFLKFIKGIPHEPDLQWYTSLMLNRLMFVYFIQKKGFLDGDVNYLRNRLIRMRQQHGQDTFYSFYRYFLLRLFHEGLGQAPAERKPELDKLLGKVPFLNGGFFEVHDLERRYPDIEIPDAAFEKLFAFFDAYRWHLDERPLRADNEINPDVVGYIFEKYVNQKQMGAYYTKEDITEYIGKNTIIPFLFDAAEKKCAIAFRPDSTLWRLLQEDPDRYIYEAVRRGVIDAEGSVIPLPEEIAAGVGDVSQRGGWNRP